MIYPVPSEKNTTRFQPWVTYSVMLLCAVVFLTTRFTARTGLGEATRLLGEAIEFHRAHPYLELDPRLEQMLPGGRTSGTGRVGGTQRTDRGFRRPELKFVGLEQMELDGLTRAGFGAVEDTLHGWWGLVPGRFSVNSLVTYMFSHVGWLHLLVSLLMLYFAGPFLEEEWNPWFFAGFYVAAGLVAGICFAIRYPGLEVPLVGASGATAGVIGACLVRYGKRKIRFGYWAGPNNWGSFRSPVWYILLAWLLRELLSLDLRDVVSPDAVGGWLAYWAHLPGFFFGVTTAVALHHFGWEARFLRSADDSGSRVLNSAALEGALARRQPTSGGDETWLALMEQTRRAPGDAEAVAALWNVAVGTQRTHEAAPVLSRLIQDQVQSGEAKEAYVNWSELHEHAQGSRLPLGLELRLAELLARQELAEESADVSRSAGGRASPDMTAGTLVRLARLTDGEERARITGLALAHSGLTNELRKDIEALTAGSDGHGTAAPSAGTRRTGTRRRSAMRVIVSVPLAIQDGNMVLEVVRGGRRTLSLQRVRSVAAASVADADSRRRYHVMDLLLDSRRGASQEPNIIRFETRRFDPRKLVPPERDVARAFLSLVGAVLATSGATWLLGTDVSRLNTYDSPRAYESALIAVIEAMDMASVASSR